MVQKVFSCNNHATKPSTPKAPRSHYCSLGREACAHQCCTMQDTVLGKTCASLYHLKYSVWLIKLIWSVRGNQEPCPATCCSPSGVTVTDAGQAGFLTLWLQVFTVFPSRAATPPEYPGSPKFLNRPRESLCTSFYLDLPTVSGINQEYLSGSHRPALRRGLKDGNSYEKLSIIITLDYIQLQILSQTLQSPQTLKITVCMSHACKLTSSAQKEAVSSACDHRCPRGYPSLGQSCVQFFLWYDLWAVCTSLEIWHTWEFVPEALSQF